MHPLCFAVSRACNTFVNKTSPRKSAAAAAQTASKRFGLRDSLEKSHQHVTLTRDQCRNVLSVILTYSLTLTCRPEQTFCALVIFHSRPADLINVTQHLKIITRVTERNERDYSRLVSFRFRKKKKKENRKRKCWPTSTYFVSPDDSMPRGAIISSYERTLKLFNLSCWNDVPRREYLAQNCNIFSVLSILKRNPGETDDNFVTSW